MTTCSERLRVDAHFSGAIRQADEHAMREHLVGCEACRARYRRHLLFAKLTPTSDASIPAEDRIGRALGFSLPSHRSRRRTVGRIIGRALPVLALAAALLLFLRSRTPADDGFTARGVIASSTAPPVSEEPLVVFQIRGDRPVRTGGTLARGDELAFSYRNVDAKPYLMIFGVDEAGHVYWFHPGWSDPHDNPAATPIPTDRAMHDLREAIRHRFEGERLEVHALFLDAPLGVVEVEAALRARGGPGALRVDGGVDHVVSFQVRP